VSSTANHTVAADRAYAPYGEQYNSFGSANPIYGVFASMTGDFDSGILFDTPNREFAQSQGRWISPDPAGAGWNQYAHVTNPNSAIDPSGLFAWYDGAYGIGDTLRGEVTGTAGGCSSSCQLAGGVSYGNSSVGADSTAADQEAEFGWIGGLSVYGPTVTDNGGQPISDGVWNGEPFMPSITGSLTYIGDPQRSDQAWALLGMAYTSAMPQPCGQGVSCGVVFPIGSVDIFEGYTAQQGFTGVYDTSTGELALVPSTGIEPIPEGWVDRSGGHADVSAALGGDPANQVGFAAVLQDDGSVQLTWKSGVLNSGPGNMVPGEMQPQITQAVQGLTTRNVNP
jgi:RHS repeat-associated protein